MQEDIIQNRKHISRKRWMRYLYLAENILKLEPKNVLDVGAGKSFLSKYLKAEEHISTTTFDIDKNNNPDVVGSVINMPFEDDSFDVVVASEVLEHLPFEDFPRALNEMKRVARKNIILTLPHQQRTLFYFALKIPFFEKIDYIKKISLNNEMKPYTEGGHYWEIGRIGYPAEKIKKTISKCGLKIINDFIPYDIPVATKHFHFFILEKGE